jgi:hypothetical protein
MLFLKQASEDGEIADGPIQIVVGEFAPPRFGFASDLFPLAFEYIFAHGPPALQKLSQVAPAPGSAKCAGFSSCPYRGQVASLN